MVMKQCWDKDPEKRPTFSQLQTKISSTLTEMAGYMEFSEFASVDSDGAGDNNVEADSNTKSD